MSFVTLDNEISRLPSSGQATHSPASVVVYHFSAPSIRVVSESEHSSELQNWTFDYRNKSEVCRIPDSKSADTPDTFPKAWTS